MLYGTRQQTKRIRRSRRGHPLKDKGVLAQKYQTLDAAITVVPAVRLAALLTSTFGLVVILGWAFDLPMLKSVLPGAEEMNANTALGLILGGLALFVLAQRPSRVPQHFAQAVALGVGALGLVTLVEYLFAWRLGIDELLFRASAGAYNSTRGRMSPYSAVAFVSIGLALVALPRPNLRLLSFSTAIVMIVIGVLSFLGYLWNASEVITDRLVPPVELNTAVGFLLLGAGTLIATRTRESHQVSSRALPARCCCSWPRAGLLTGLPPNSRRPRNR
jgi:hypothetical protein